MGGQAELVQQEKMRQGGSLSARAGRGTCSGVRVTLLCQSWHLLKGNPIKDFVNYSFLAFLGINFRVFGERLENDSICQY